MGVVNVTPDSFSDGGHHLRTDDAVAHGRALLAAGADWLDVGGESTRPGAAPVSEGDELRRVLPVVEALASDGARVSIDTRKPAVARAAAGVGATLLNDVGAAQGAVAAELGIGWVAMHALGEPATMQDDPRYHDVVAEVLDHLLRVAAEAEAAGAADVWIDPGIGFGKTMAHNLTLLAHLDAFVASGRPVVVGTSRKAFLGHLLGASDGTSDPAPTDDRLEGSLATATWALTCGAAMVRVHDVRATVHAAEVIGGQITKEAA